PVASGPVPAVESAPPSASSPSPSPAPAGRERLRPPRDPRRRRGRSSLSKPPSAPPSFSRSRSDAVARSPPVASALAGDGSIDRWSVLAGVGVGAPVFAAGPFGAAAASGDAAAGPL